MYPELQVSSSSGVTSLSLTLTSAGNTATVHLSLPASYPATALTLTLSGVRGYLSDSCLLASLQGTTGGASPLELFMAALESLSTTRPPCPICLELVADDSPPTHFSGPCQHLFHSACCARYICERLELHRASAAHAAAGSARAALASASLGRLRVAEAAAAYAATALDSCLARLAGLQAQLAAQPPPAAAGGSSSGGGGGAKRALPPSKLRRFEAEAEQGGAADAAPLPTQIERTLAEAATLRAAAAAAEAKLGAVRADPGVASASSGGGSGGGGGGGGEGGSPLEEHLQLAQEVPLPCPVCRVPFPSSCTQKFYAAWARQHFEGTGSARSTPAPPAPTTPAAPLPAALAAQLADMGKRFKLLWQRQAAKQGIIEAKGWLE